MKGMMDAVDKLTSGTGAPIKARLSSLAAQSKRLAKSQTEAQARLDQYQNQLTKQFSAMDNVVGKYKTIGNQLTSIFNKSNSSNDG